MFIQEDTTAPTPEAGGVSESLATPEAAAPISFEDYFNTIPEDKRTILSKNGVKDTDTLLSSYEGLLSLKGKKTAPLNPPPENATDAEKAEFQKALYNHLGVPETGEYEFNTPEGVDAEIIDTEFVNALAGVASKNGINASGFQAIIDTIYPAYQAEIKGYQEKLQALQEKVGETGSMDSGGNIQTTASNEQRAESLYAKYVELYGQNKILEADKVYQQFLSLKGY